MPANKMTIAGMARSYGTMGAKRAFHKCPANVKMYP